MSAGQGKYIDKYKRLSIWATFFLTKKPPHIQCGGLNNLFFHNRIKIKDFFLSYN
jgi:hypothetical protein